MNPARSLSLGLLLLLHLGVALSSPQPLAGQAVEGREEPTRGVEATPDEEPPEPLPEALASPRATMRTFLEAFPERDWSAAISALDLSELDLPPDVVAVRGRELAIELKDVIDRVAYVSFDEIPTDPEGERWVWQRVDGLAIALERTDRGWLFSSATLDRLPRLLDAVSEREVVEGVTEAPRTLSMWVRARVPEALRSGGFLLEHWQWLGLAVLVFLGVLADRLLTLALRPLVARRLQRRRSEEEVTERETARRASFEVGLIARVTRPVGLIAMAVVWWLGLYLLGLPPKTLSILLLAVQFVAIAAVVWTAYRLVDLLAEMFARRAAATESKYDDVLVPLLRKSAKIFIAAFGVVFLADNSGLDITSLLAGLGIGGVALALAAKNTVENLFGSFTVLLDRPFQVGDWVVVGDVEGTVEEVGFRSTRIRTFYDSLITLPNANLISAGVDNYGARRYRRWKTYVGVTYDTPPERIDAFCEGIRELVRRHPYTRKDSFHVYLNAFGAASLDILLYIFFATPDWATELRERHRLGIDILRLAKRLGVEIAFPTQTLYLRKEEHLAPGHDQDYGQAQERGLRGARAEARELVDSVLEGTIPPPVGAEEWERRQS